MEQNGLQVNGMQADFIFGCLVQSDLVNDAMSRAFHKVFHKVDGLYQNWYCRLMNSDLKRLPARFYRSDSGREPVWEWLKSLNV
jgi:hypothetical protein